MHDSQELDGLLDEGNTCNDVFADSAYRSAEIEAKLRASAYNSRIHRRGRRNHPLSLAQVRVNHAKSRIRARIEHVFGAQQNAPGGRIVRTIGIVRARAKIGSAEPGLQHSPPGDAGTARSGMTVELSAVFQPKQWAEKASREDNRKQDPTRTCAQSGVESNIVRGALNHHTRFRLLRYEIGVTFPQLLR